MLHRNLKTIGAATVTTLLFIAMASFTAKPGGTDSYEIYLNNKLLLKQYVTQPLTLKSLQLNKTNINDQLVIYYSHCGQIGKGRKIAIRDEKGNIVKEWKFANNGDGMTIPVKELLALEQKNLLSIFYTSEQLPQGRMLTGLHV